MRKLLATLYVTTDGCGLALKEGSVLVRKAGETLARLPVIAVESIVCFGNVGCSPALMGTLAQSGICLSFLSHPGRFLATVHGEAPGNVMLRRQQFRMADRHETSLAIAREIVLAKVAKSRALLIRAARDQRQAGSPGRDPLRHAAGRLRATAAGARSCSSIDALRGYEGEAARHYFQAFDSLRSPAADPAFAFATRTRRPPLDPVNALLSFVYALLLHDCRAACATAGLDAFVGFLHEDRSGKPSLALDLMEELRGPVADRFVLSLVNLRQLRAEHFITLDDGSVRLTDPARKILLAAWQLRKRDEIRHPYTGESTPVGLLPFVQATLLARHIRGDLDRYHPWLARS